MFTGIIEEVGRIESILNRGRSIRLSVAASKVIKDTQVGDSISTNGVCLTVTTITSTGFTADVMPESVQRTALKELKVGSKVNLERALTLSTRLGGHIVSGHIDGTGVVRRRTEDDTALWLWIECPDTLMRYIIEKGSVAINGVSLTVARVEQRSFAVSLIPHTQGATTLHNIKVGERVNIENDIIAKYVEKFTVSAPDTTEKAALYRSIMGGI